jgi:hypothetical protein
MSFEYAKGAGYAAVSAGPIFVLAFAMETLITGRASPRDLAVLPLVLLIAIPVAIPFGAIAGTIPIALGGFIMGWLGQRHRTARRNTAWGFAGLVLALPLAALLLGASMLEHVTPFAFTGAVCALLVRYGTRWNDDSV